MGEYHRILSYLYRYDKKQKKDCKGFIKAEQKPSGLKLTIQIDDDRLMEDMVLTLSFYGKKGDDWVVKTMARLNTDMHHEEMIIFYPSEQLPTGFEIRKQHGVILFYQESLCYGSVWIGEELPMEELLPELQKGVLKERAGEERDKNIENIDIAVQEKSQPKLQKESQPEPQKERKKESQPELQKEPKRESPLELGEEPQKEARPENTSEDDSNFENNPEMDETEMEGEAEKESNEISDRMAIRNQENGVDGELYKSQNESKNKIEGTEKTKAEMYSEIMSMIESKLEKKEENGRTGQISEGETLKEEELSTEKEDRLKTMWINTNKQAKQVDNIFNPAFRSGYKISAEQLGAFGEEAKKLADNQFLVKGYTRYHHLLAGKVLYAGEERYCVGVPGIYENRERYMAEIYRFPVFLSLAENRIKTGGFGYWLHLLQE